MRAVRVAPALPPLSPHRVPTHLVGTGLPIHRQHHERWIVTLMLALALTLGTSAETSKPAPPQRPVDPTSGESANSQKRDIRYVIQPMTEVRSGPSAAPKLYPTQELRRGDAVEVVAELPGGWLAIRPPVGSFSWINTRFLQHIVPNQANYVVVREGVKAPVMVGSVLHRTKPTVIGVRVPRGTQVRSIGQPKAAEDGSWMPIEPPSGERRYIQADAVSRIRPSLSPANTSPAQMARASAQERTSPLSGAQPPAEAEMRVASSALTSLPAHPAQRSRSRDIVKREPSSQEGARAAPGVSSFRYVPASRKAPGSEQANLWTRAERAERQGDLEEAIRLYTLLGQTERTNPQQALQARNRASYLREWQKKGHTRPPTPNPPPMSAVHANPTRHPTPPGEFSRVVRHVVPARGGASLRTASQGAVASRTPRLDSEPSIPRSQLRRSGKGWLERSTARDAGRQLYLLLDDQSRLLLYAIPGPGIDLEPYLNQKIELIGPVTVKIGGAIRGRLMTVTEVLR